jgi:hypothetical protein
MRSARRRIRVECSFSVQVRRPPYISLHVCVSSSSSAHRYSFSVCMNIRRDGDHPSHHRSARDEPRSGRDHASSCPALLGRAETGFQPDFDAEDRRRYQHCRDFHHDRVRYLRSTFIRSGSDEVADDSASSLLSLSDITIVVDTGKVKETQYEVRFTSIPSPQERSIQLTSCPSIVSNPSQAEKSMQMLVEVFTRSVQHIHHSWPSPALLGCC